MRKVVPTGCFVVRLVGAKRLSVSARMKREVAPCWLTAAGQLLVIRTPPDHLRLGEAWGLIHGWSVQLLDEPAPREGPLLALQRLMDAHPDDYLFVAPVDLPNLEPTGLQTLLAEAEAEPQTITLASDGSQLQPLLGLYPPSAHLRQTLCQSLIAGNRSLKGWLAAVPYRSVPLPADQLLNINCPAELQALTP